jgi:serine/threonine protein kinase
MGTAEVVSRIGRFELKRLLGKGAQSAVHLAYDPQLDREVAIKTLHLGRGGDGRGRALLEEARAVAKLRHGNIVPIFDAGEHQGEPYLVFEYVEGATLAQFMREQGRVPPLRAAEIMLGVLDGIGHAHRFGTIHRDLKPSNILLAGDSVPRVMDFGVAVQVRAPKHGGGALVGTPAYMAPEYIAEGVAGEQCDIFAAGLVLFEMLFAQRAFAGEGPFQVMYRITSEDLAIPAAPASIDEGMLQILRRATARDPKQRFLSTEQMHAALAEYLRPAIEASFGGSQAGRASTLEFLLRRMRHKSDFPALSDAISAINRLSRSETESINALSSSVLKDFALTNKILRVVNSAYYRRAGGGSISTVSRAVVTLGFDAIRNLAVSLSLFEHLEDRKNAGMLREELLRANLTGMLARACSGTLGLGDGEEVFICALFHNLGRLLAQFYFPDEAEEIRRQQEQANVPEDTAAARVLGIGYEDLGVEMARVWGFPASIQRSMERLPAGPVRTPQTREERLRALASFASELAVALESAGGKGADLAGIRQRFGNAVPLSERQLDEVLQRSVDEMQKLAGVLQVNLRQTRLGRQLAGEAARRGQESAPAAALDDLPPLGAAPDAVAQPESGGEPEAPAGGGVDAHAVLAAGIQDISNSLVESFSLTDVLRMVLETMYRAMGFEHVLLCLRDARSNTMAARFGFGPESESLVRRFRFTLAGGSDVFNVVLARGVDVLISDADDPKIAQRIPDWYRKAVGARTFIVFPLSVGDRTVAMIYADRRDAGDIVIAEKELSLLRTLRNQAVLAIKQSA